MRYLIWDFDGTLGYRSGGWSRACVDAIEATTTLTDVRIEDIRQQLQDGFPWHTPYEPHPDISSADEWWDQLYPVLTAAIEAVGVAPDRTAETARQVRSTYVTDDWHRFEETIPTLQRLASDGWTHFVLSNHVPELNSILRELGLLRYLEEAYVSATIGYEKPHPAAFRAVTAELEEEATVWVIGDSYRADVLGARSIGLPAVLVRSTHPDSEPCCATLDGLEDILPES